MLGQDIAKFHRSTKLFFVWFFVSGKQLESLSYHVSYDSPLVFCRPFPYLLFNELVCWVVVLISQRLTFVWMERNGGKHWYCFFCFCSCLWIAGVCGGSMYLCLGCSKMAPKMRRPLSHSDISVLFLYSPYLYSQLTITVVQNFLYSSCIHCTCTYKWPSQLFRYFCTLPWFAVLVLTSVTDFSIFRGWGAFPYVLICIVY